MDILRIDSSPRYEESKSRARADALIEHLKSEHGDVSITTRDVAPGLPYLDADWIAAKNTDPSDTTPEQEKTLGLALEMVDELKAADVIVISVPVYNFTVPASLKSWADHVALPRRTFRYTEYGPKGLLEGKRAILLFASGGTEIGSDIDYASDWLTFFLGFIGITDVTVLGGRGDVNPKELVAAYEA